MAATGLLRLVVSLALLGCMIAPWSHAGVPWAEYLNRPDEWYRSSAGTQAVENVLSWQLPAGAWPKNVDTTIRPFAGKGDPTEGTFDNGATTSELHFLARAHHATGNERSRAAFQRGLNLVLEAQYPTGGWPQSFPLRKGYPRHITFNDGTMVRIMELLRAVAAAPSELVDEARRRAAKAAFDRGVDCILKCQIRVGGHLTVWCAQHDEVTLAPRPARKYELVSLSGAESAGILALLMSLDDPSPGAVQAIEAGAAWFANAKLTGIRQVRVDGDKRIVADPSAPPLWARFYEIETGRPFFCGRDGVPKYSLSEIEAERRNGYAWYGDWGEAVARADEAWRRKWGHLAGRTAVMEEGRSSIPAASSAEPPP